MVEHTRKGVPDPSCDALPHSPRWNVFLVLATSAPIVALVLHRVQVSPSGIKANREQRPAIMRGGGGGWGDKKSQEDYFVLKINIIRMQREPTHIHKQGV